MRGLGADDLDVDAGVSPALVGFMTTLNTLVRAVMIPVYGR